jgi:hypothetical protein
MNCFNATGISFTSSSASAQINLTNCQGNIANTGIALFSSSSAGTLMYNYCVMTNTGGSTTANTISAGKATMFFAAISNPITTSSTAALGLELFDMNTVSQNVTCLTHNGSGGANVVHCRFSSGTASAISIGGTMTITICDIFSSNTNAITGAGTITYAGLTFSSTSKTINTTTQTNAGTLQGSTTTAPTAGYLGERITSYLSGGTPSNNTPTTLTSINLTAGVWDISCFTDFAFSGAATVALANISTTTNTIVGNKGDAYSSIQLAAIINACVTVPVFRVVITTTTSYFLVVQANFSTGAATVSGRITGVRVG